jgi:hypothetical protein
MECLFLILGVCNIIIDLQVFELMNMLFNHLGHLYTRDVTQHIRELLKLISFIASKGSLSVDYEVGFYFYCCLTKRWHS